MEAYEKGIKPRCGADFYDTTGFVREFGSAARIAARGSGVRWEC